MTERGNHMEFVMRQHRLAIHALLMIIFGCELETTSSFWKSTIVPSEVIYEYGPKFAARY